MDTFNNIIYQINQVAFLSKCVNNRPNAVFRDKKAMKCLSSLHNMYIVMPAEKPPNDIVFVSILTITSVL